MEKTPGVNKETINTIYGITMAAGLRQTAATPGT